MATYGDWSEIWEILTRNAVPSKGSPHVTEKPKIYADTFIATDRLYLPAYAMYQFAGRAVIAQGSEDGERLEALGCDIDEESSRWYFMT